MLHFRNQYLKLFALRYRNSFSVIFSSFVLCFCIGKSRRRQREKILLKNITAAFGFSNITIRVNNRKRLFLYANNAIFLSCGLRDMYFVQNSSPVFDCFAFSRFLLVVERRMKKLKRKFLKCESFLHI